MKMIEGCYLVWRFSLVILLAIAMFAGPSLAQKADRPKVKKPPPAQTPQTVVPVEQEPSHRVVFENKNVRVSDAEFPPGKISLFHKHSFDNVTILASGGTGMNEILSSTPQPFTLPTGFTTFARGTNAPYTHRVKNVGTTPLRFITVEVLASAPLPGVPAVLDAVPGHSMIIDNDRVKVYRVSVDPKQSTGTRSRTSPWMRISVSPATISIQEQGKSAETLETKTGDFRWHEGATNQSIENIGSTTYTAYEIEWKFVPVAQAAQQKQEVISCYSSTISEVQPSKKTREVAQKWLKEAMQLANSKYGWVGVINKNGRVDILAMSDSTWEVCTVSFIESSLVNIDLRGIRGRVLKEQRSILTNSPELDPDWIRPPDGHVRIENFLGIPLKQGGRIVGMLALANKESGYEPSDQMALERLSIDLVTAICR
jgi:GAF domain-containing protein/quercetin dioxygenase-like cupin family protein